MNRRNLFALLAAAPFAAAALKETTEAKPALPKLDFPVGHLRDSYVLAPDYGYSAIHDHCHGLTTNGLPSHQHAVSGYSYPTRAIVRRQIYDGKQFVDFDSAAGAAVHNSLLANPA